MVTIESHFDTMLVCKKWGHEITDLYDSVPARRQAFCEKCGSSTTFQCLFCGAKIRGYHHVEGVIGGKGPDVPLNCHKCGRPYPWKNKLLIKRFSHACVSPIKYVVDSIVGIFKK